MLRLGSKVLNLAYIPFTNHTQDERGTIEILFTIIAKRRVKAAPMIIHKDPFMLVLGPCNRRKVESHGLDPEESSKNCDWLVKATCQMKFVGTGAWEKTGEKKQSSRAWTFFPPRLIKWV